ncbi:MAG: WbqC family protein [Bacteroidota bacterium]
MQPYLFPYIGYFQLINSVDKFVIYDDVAYIKQGWINRNRILLGKKPFLFTVPVANASSSKKIKDTFLNEKTFSTWRGRFYKTIEMAYKRAPYYENVLPLIREVLDKEVKSIAELCRNSIVKIITYLGIQTEIVVSSVIYKNDNLKSSERVIDICLKENATSYINAPGGSSLYNKRDFSKYNVNLKFLISGSIFYRQFENDFVPALSIIDVMMFNSTEVISGMLNDYTLE